MNDKKKRLLHFAVAIGVIAVGALIMGILIALKPELETRKPKTPIPLVRTIRVETGPQTVIVKGEGTVHPLREIALVPEVGGKVISISPSLVNGGSFGKGDTLLRIDPVDYELEVTLAQAKVKDAESNLQLAEEEAAASIEEWRLHRSGNGGPEKDPPPLVAKKPQLAAAQARLEAERADFRKVLLNLERTKLKAPFDGRVSQENVDIGQYVTPGQTLATLYSTEAAEIVVPLENKDLLWFRVPGFTPGRGDGSPAMVQARIAGRELTWKGRVVRTEGRLDERTRLINVVVRVERPYAKRPPLAVGLFVAVEIKGRTLSDAVLIPRAAMREKNVVWVIEEGNHLRFRKVDVARIQDRNVLVRSGLNNGEAVVVTPLKAVTNGMTVRTVSGSEEEAS